ncbi:MAG: hypothetical protein HQK89_05155 [Nitrospirae bacterium]|nr:hypothetical protein [Nitrospirota bacterium]
MKKDFRYTMEHLGDYLVDMTAKVAGSARISARGVILTYDIRRLRKKKKSLMIELGKRLVELRKEDPGLNAGRDEKTRELLSAIDDNEAKLDEFLYERQKRLYSSCKCTGDETAESDTGERPLGDVPPEDIHVRESSVVTGEAVARDSRTSYDSEA